MKYKSTPYKRRKLYQKSEQNKYDLERLENKEELKNFGENSKNVIKVLHDSGYKQKAAVGINNMVDYLSLSTFDNEDYDWKTYWEYAYS